MIDMIKELYKISKQVIQEMRLSKKVFMTGDNEKSHEPATSCYL